MAEIGSEEQLTVHEEYKANLDKGMTAKEAAKDAQARTGLSLVTGKRFKDQGGPSKYNIKGLKYKGQYG